MINCILISLVLLISEDFKSTPQEMALVGIWRETIINDDTTKPLPMPDKVGEIILEDNGNATIKNLRTNENDYIDSIKGTWNATKTKSEWASSKGTVLLTTPSIIIKPTRFTPPTITNIRMPLLLKEVPGGYGKYELESNHLTTEKLYFIKSGRPTSLTIEGFTVEKPLSKIDDVPKDPSFLGYIVTIFLAILIVVIILRVMKQKSLNDPYNK